MLKQRPSELRIMFQASFGGVAIMSESGFDLLSLLPAFVVVASFGGGAILSESGFDLLSQLLAFDPDRRISCEDAMNHRWFSEAPLPTKKELMPMFNPRGEEGAKKPVPNNMMFGRK
eukprot:gene1013-3847_t